MICMPSEHTQDALSGTVGIDHERKPAGPGPNHPLELMPFSMTAIALVLS